ncbi:MAG: Sir2 family NAD-dependent protein deacetylase [Planctomycetota bacterium]|nr:Sir2 family NAD-dependent protein deacetylase [Planctomycetota bacterium]
MGCSDAITPAQCAERLRAARCAVALTGAGISTAAGIPDFRGPQGLYAAGRYDPLAVFDIEHFRADPLPFFDFTRDFLPVLEQAQPTFAHRFLARWEEAGGLAAVVTQNIDMLHQKAGSRRIIAVHGDYSASRCLACGKPWGYEQLARKVREEPVPRCGCGGGIKPEVVFFGEMVRNLDLAYEAVSNCDFLLVLGSSLRVYPAAALPEYTAAATVVINRGATGLPPGRERFFVEADVQEYTYRLAEALGWV